MDLFSPYRDHLLVQVDLNDSLRTAGGVFIPEWQRGDHDPTRAVVLAVPQGLSIAPLPFGGMDGQHYTFADLQELPKVGDTVYIKYNSLHPDLEMPGHAGVFLLSLERVVAMSSPEGLRPFQGLLLCEEVYGDDVRQREDGVRERASYVRDLAHDERGWDDELALPYQQAKQVATEINPLPEPFTLRILHAGQPLRGQQYTVAVGDVIIAHRMLFAYHAVKQKDDEEASERWMHEAPKITIEGREYAYVPRQCVMGKREPARYLMRDCFGPIKTHRAVTDLSNEA